MVLCHKELTNQNNALCCKQGYNTRIIRTKCCVVIYMFYIVPTTTTSKLSVDNVAEDSRSVPRVSAFQRTTCIRLPAYRVYPPSGVRFIDRNPSNKKMARPWQTSRTVGAAPVTCIKLIKHYFSKLRELHAFI